MEFSITQPRCTDGGSKHLTDMGTNKPTQTASVGVAADLPVLYRRRAEEEKKGRGSDSEEESKRKSKEDRETHEG